MVQIRTLLYDAANDHEIVKYLGQYGFTFIPYDEDVNNRPFLLDVIVARARLEIKELLKDGADGNIL